jgi:hypothetical protein
MTNKLAEIIIYNLPKSAFTHKLRDSICEYCHQEYQNENFNCEHPCVLVQYIDIKLKEKENKK